MAKWSSCCSVDSHTAAPRQAGTWQLVDALSEWPSQPFRWRLRSRVASDPLGSSAAKLHGWLPPPSSEMARCLLWNKTLCGASVSETWPPFHRHTQTDSSWREPEWQQRSLSGHQSPTGTERTHVRLRLLAAHPSGFPLISNQSMLTNGRVGPASLVASSSSSLGIVLCGLSRVLDLRRTSHQDAKCKCVKLWSSRSTSDGCVGTGKSAGIRAGSGSRLIASSRRFSSSAISLEVFSLASYSFNLSHRISLEPQTGALSSFNRFLQVLDLWGGSTVHRSVRCAACGWFLFFFSSCLWRHNTRLSFFSFWCLR